MLLVCVNIDIHVGITNMLQFMLIATFYLLFIHIVLVYCTPSCVHGFCVGTNTCVCGEGYEGEQCSDIGKNMIQSSDDMPFI